MTRSAFARRSALPPLAFGVGIVFLLALAWWAYRPGLAGGFIFDDFANLPTLGAFGPVDNATTFWRYLTSGTADPTGRPLAMASFLIDARDWPADPAPFKRTSVLIHLANGALLAWLLYLLGRTLLRDARKAALAALFGSAMWLLHPLFVSTVLYIVQREAMLPATFVTLGLIAYIGARALILRGSLAGPPLAVLAIGLSTLLAVAAKANGVLLPLLAWLVDVIVLAPNDGDLDARTRRALAWTRRVALGAPSVLILIALAWTGARYASEGVPDFRPWTFGERLLTEGRVVADYLALLVLPHPYTAGVFNDAVAPSTGFFSPATTALCLMFLGALVALAVAVRRRAPALSLAILFYFAGHLLESTVIPLELYYEHRNYLPALLLFWPIGVWLVGRDDALVLRRALMIALPLLLAGLTHMGADLWGNVPQQALVWAAKNPQSPRAQAYAAQIERTRGDSAAAIARLRHVPVEQSTDIQIVLNLVAAECDLGRADEGDVRRAANALRTARITGQLGYTWLGNAIDRIASGNACAGLGAAEIHALLDAAAANPYGKSYGRVQDNLNLRARLALAEHDPATALDYFNRSLDAKPLPEVGLQQAALLGNAGYPGEALKHLAHLEQVWKPGTAAAFSMQALHERLLLRSGYWAHEIDALRAALEASAAAGAKP